MSFSGFALIVYKENGTIFYPMSRRLPRKNAKIFTSYAKHVHCLFHKQGTMKDHGNVPITTIVTQISDVDGKSSLT